MAVTVNVQEAKTHLSDLLKRVEAGEEVVIARAGTPIAELRPVRRAELVFGGFEVSLSDDFFEPMSEGELAAWEGGEVEPAP